MVIVISKDDEMRSLSFNNIGYKGGTALLEGLETNTTITYLGCVAVCALYMQM